MDQSLCFKGNLDTLIKKEVENMEFHLVDKEVSKVPENEWQQLMPYVVFRNVKGSDARVEYLQYQRAEREEDDDYLKGKVSFGFSSVVETADDIVSSEIVTNEDSSVSYKLTLEDIVNTAIKTAVRKVQKDLGFDLTTSGLNISTEIIKNNASFFRGDLNEDINKVHVGILILIDCNTEQMETIVNGPNVNVEVITKLSVLGVNLDVIVEEMDINNTVVKITNQLFDNNMDNWSCLVFDYLLKLTVNQLIGNVTYKDMYAVAEAKRVADTNQDEKLYSEHQGTL